MNIPFIKIDNAGNDYVYISQDSISRLKTSIGSLARRISDRNRGVGADGLIVVDILDPGSAFMRIFNSDGSESELCGNGLRGVALFLRKTEKSRRRQFSVATRWREYRLDLIKSDQSSILIGTSLGSPSFAAKDIGFAEGGKHGLGIRLQAGENERELYCLAMPSPHAVIFVDNLGFNWQEEGREIENSPLFKNRVNVMFARVDSRRSVTVLPWERGSEATLACGSGAGAVCVISHLLGKTGSSISVRMPGGILKTKWDLSENEIFQAGSSRVAFTGQFQF
jgi:diaminopimelate epimerase